MSKSLLQTRNRFIKGLDGLSVSLQIVMIATQTLGIDLRKHVINTVQTADMSFAKLLEADLPYYLNCRRPHGIRITRVEYMDALRIVCTSVVSRSIVWVLAKSCPEPKDNDQSLEVRKAGFQKELSATQVIFSNSQIFNYKKPTRQDTRHFVPTREVASRFVAGLQRRQKPIFPCVNRVKNVSRSAALLYQSYDNSRDIASIRTVDLEIMWRNAGIKIQGASEIRETWKLNELKPRFYFCQGGESYWAARYIKPIVVTLLEAISATKKDTRLHLPNSLQFNVHQDTVMIWDYTSFTSSLSELKFFINRLIDLVPSDLEVLAFDYRYGKGHINVQQLLTDYNRDINTCSTFSVERIDPELRGSIPILAEFLSMNSGLLGTNGNIGFSMANHGIVIDSIDSKGRSGCSIGDDAIKITQDPEHVISIMIQLGHIHPEKFGIMFDEGVLRFMKRRLWIDTDGQLRIDALIAFPAFSVVDDESIGTRTTGCSTESEREAKIVGQISNAVWALPAINHLLDDEDRAIVKHYLAMVYQTMQFPMRGAHRGGTTSKHKRLPWAIPPVYYDEVFTTPWHEVLVDQDPGQWAEIHQSYHVEITHIPEAGEVLVWNESPFLSVLEDLNIAKSEAVTEVVYCNTLANRVRIKQAYDKFRKHEPKVVKVTMLQSIPDEFRSMFAIRTGYVDTCLDYMLQ